MFVRFYTASAKPWSHGHLVGKELELDRPKNLMRGQNGKGMTEMSI